MCMKNFLTAQEITELKAQHKRERDRRIADRIKAVIHKNNGWTNKEIAEALFLDEETVSKHVNEYFANQKLKPENGGSRGNLSSQQIEELDKHLKEKTYETTGQIIKHIEEAYGVTYTQSGVNNLLHRLDFSYKKPTAVPAKADLEKQKQFIEAYEKLKKETPENEPILFGDSVHPTMATKIVYGWIKKGQDKPIATIASRTRVNLTGAICLKDFKIITQSSDTINGESTIEFLKKLKDTYPDAPFIHIILDRAGYNRCQAVNEFARTSNIKIHLLPPYSPNLNPIERLWKFMNEKVRNNKVFSSAEEFRKKINNFFEIIYPKSLDELKSRINDSFQILATKSASSC